jgi:L-alanine-DL-glutamate epimerase-like enolase superfamily enzyme
MLMRLDTNQGISGYGEIRYDASKTRGLMLKSRIIGMNPCNVAEIFRKIKKQGGFGCAGCACTVTPPICRPGKRWGTI